MKSLNDYVEEHGMDWCGMMRAMTLDFLKDEEEQMRRGPGDWPSQGEHHG